MNFVEETPFGPLPLSLPPAKLRVYAPNGDRKEVVAYLGIRGRGDECCPAELFLAHESGAVEVLNRKVVVKNLETGMVCYDPRNAPTYFGARRFLTSTEELWLIKNPSWPAILELEDNPVENGEEEPTGFNP